MRVVVPRNLAEVNVATTSETLQFWHERLGHQDNRHVLKVLESMGINVSMAKMGNFCDRCVLGKAYWKPFTVRLP
jgi:hypothetical protein